MEPGQISKKAPDIAKLPPESLMIDGALATLQEFKSQLSPAQVARLKDLLKTVSESSNAGSRIEMVGFYKAVVGTMTLNGKQFDTLLSERSKHQTTGEQHEYARELGYEVAGGELAEAYLRSLHINEANGSPNSAEAHALAIIRTYDLRHTEGALNAAGEEVNEVWHPDANHLWHINDYPYKLTLFVRPSRQSE